MPQRNSLLAIVAILAPLGLCRADPPATQPAAGPPAASGPTLAEQKDESRRGIAYWERLPLLARRPISSVLRLAIADDYLTIDWPIAGQGPVTGRLELTDLPGEAIVTYPPNPRHLAYQVGPMFELYDFSDPHLVCKHLQVIDSSLNLQIDEDFEYPLPHGVLTISLLQTTTSGDTGWLTLRVQIPSGTDVVLTARTLSTLRRDHPLEYEKYVRPLLGAFRQEQDEKSAWQVMRQEWTPPDGLARRVQALVAQMNADDYSVREAANHQLRQLGEPAALYLLTADRRSFTAEQKARTDKILADFCPLSGAQVTALAGDVNFLLDCLDSNDADLRAATLRRLTKVLGRQVRFDLNQPPAARMAAIAALRARLAPLPTKRGAAN